MPPVLIFYKSCLQIIPATAEKNMIVPHAVKFFGDDVRKGKLLQILIEIASLL